LRSECRDDDQREQSNHGIILACSPDAPYCRPVTTRNAAPAADSLDRTAILVVVGVFVALVIDGMDLQILALALPTLSREMHLSNVSAGALSTYTLLGMGIGGILAGWLADRIGRVRVVWWAVLIFSTLTSVIAWCHSYWQIAVMRCVSGFGLGALYSIGTLLAAEYVPTRMRTTVLGTLQAGWSVGYVAAALLSASVLPRFGWRPLFAFAIVPGIVTLALLWSAPDPPGWTAFRRGSIRGRTGGTFRMLWADAPVRRTFLLWTMAAIALQFGYYGANSWLPSYLVKDLNVNVQSMGWYVAGTYTMMVIGKIVTGYLADIVGRRTMWIVSGLLTAAYLPVLIFSATPANVAYLLLVFGFLYGAPYAINATYLSESFPARVRATAVATSYNLGRIGSTLSPLLIGMAAERYSIGLGIALLGISYALCALVPGVFIPEKMFDPRTAAPAVTSGDRLAAGSTQ
jgi:MFS transporter, AAHS family, cis,cis-muconate transporter